jgi:ATP-dependent RNA helicase RhlE
MTFKNFGLIEQLITAVTDMGYTVPTAIQAQAIPLVLEGSDLMACSQTGTGKTAGFTLPLLQNLQKNTRDTRRMVRALILTPTRELCLQVHESVTELGRHLPFKALAIFGGVNINKQIDRVRQGVDIIVATPGRLLDLVNQKVIDLSQVEILVLDEADRMLDMGFIHDIRKILGMLPKKRQNLLFSATFSDDIKRLANGLLNSPKMISATKTNSTAAAVTQTVHPVDNTKKRALLSHLISTKNWKQVLVFTRTKHGANRLAEQLTGDGIVSSAIHGNKSQSARVKALDDFKKGNCRVLVATDIAARGLDIEQLPHVVNFELPNVPEDYVHRIGRTGRAGCSGEAISLVCVDEHKLLFDIEKLLNRKLEQVVVESFEPDPKIKAVPIVNGRQMAPRKPNQGPRPANKPKVAFAFAGRRRD